MYILLVGITISCLITIYFKKDKKKTFEGTIQNEQLDQYYNLKYSDNEKKNDKKFEKELKDLLKLAYLKCNSKLYYLNDVVAECGRFYYNDLISEKYYKNLKEELEILYEERDMIRCEADSYEGLPDQMKRDLVHLESHRSEYDPSKNTTSFFDRREFLKQRRELQE